MSGTGTTAVHGDGAPEDPTGPVAPPTYRTSTFRFADTEGLLAGERGEGPSFYTRYGHPNFERVERTLAALHGAEDAVLFASGMAAIAAVVNAFCAAGDRVVALRELYGGTRALLQRVAERGGVEVARVSAGDMDALEAALPGARLLMGESPSNPLLETLDLPAYAERCRAHGVLFVLDATLAGPLNLAALAHGVDVVVESATKSLGGHSDLMAGFVVGGRDALREVRLVRKLFGAVADPETAWLLERSLKTLPVRVARQAETAGALARRLAADDRVPRVIYPGLASHPGHALAERLGQGPGAMITLGLGGGLDRARAVIDRLRLIANAPSLGGVESVASLPALTSHAMLTTEQRAAAGISDDLLRLSIGLEDAEDLWADLDQALGTSG